MRKRQGRQPAAVSGGAGSDVGTTGPTAGSAPLTPGRGLDQEAARAASGGGAFTAAARTSETRGPGPMGTWAPASRTGPVSGAPTDTGDVGTTGSCEGGGGTGAGRAPPPLRPPPCPGFPAGRPLRRASIRLTARSGSQAEAVPLSS